jgi:hypothetical protein
MDVHQLSELSYKELQAQAKLFSIAANQKKEVLVQEIFAYSQGNNENNSAAANHSESGAVADSLKVPSTPLGCKISRVTRSTAKKTVSHAVEEVVASPIAPEPEVVTNDCSVDTSADNIFDSVQATGDASKSSPLAHEDENAQVCPISNCKNAVSFADLLEMDPVTPNSEDYNEEDEEYPNPTTLFEAEDDLDQHMAAMEISKANKISINRHVYFTSPDGKGNVQEVSAGEECGSKHLHFASPDLCVGNKVRWTYDEYSATADESSEAAQENQIDESRDDDSETEEVSRQQRMKLAPGHGDKVMNFWLSKAFASTAAKFFK